jgi:hypothetical protein
MLSFRTPFYAAITVVIVVFVAQTLHSESWLPTHGPEGGSVDQFLQDPVVEDTLYAKTAYATTVGGGRIHRSTDYGETWQTTAVPDGVWDLVAGVDAVYATTATDGIGGSQFLYLSLDGGGTWISHPFPGATGDRRLAADPAVPGKLYAAVQFQGAFKSVDYGASWVAINTGLPSTSPLAIFADPLRSGVTFALAPGGLWKRVDGNNATWTSVPSPPGASLLNDRFYIDPVRPQTLFYTLPYNGPGGAQVHRSTNDGATWTPLTVPGPPGVLVTEYLLSIDPRTDVLFAFSRNGGLGTLLQMSLNAGDTWSLPVLTGVPDYHVAPSYLISATASGLTLASGAQFFSATQVGIYKLDSGASTWRPVNIGFANAEVGLIAADKYHTQTVLATATNPVRSLHRSEDAGQTWAAATSGAPSLAQGSGGYFTSSAATADLFFYGGYYIEQGGTPSKTVLRTTDGGHTWTISLSECDIVSAVVDRAGSPGLAYVPCWSTGLRRSTDSGATWSVVNNSTIGLLTIDRDDPQILYGQLGLGGNIVKSTDGGVTFGDTGFASPLTLTQDFGGTLYATRSGFASGGVYNSTDRGGSWNPVCSWTTDGCTDVGVIFPDPVRAGVLYTRNGRIFRSTNGGVTWNGEFQDGTAGYGFSASISADGATMYLGTRSASVKALSLMALANCTYSLSRTHIDIDAGGGLPLVDVNTGSGCAWSGYGNDNAIWLSFATNPQVGPGRMSVRVNANPGAARAGNIVVAGQVISVSQSANAGCTFAQSSYTQAYGPAGGSGSVTMTPNNGSCVWTATNDVPWVTITSAVSGVGATTVTFTVAANPGPANRSGSIVVGGAQLGVTQTAAPIPDAITDRASGISRYTALLVGSANPHGLGTTAQFQYGSTLPLAAATPIQSIGAGNAAVPIGAGTITGLSCNTIYYARAVAASSAGTTLGQIVPFKTAACPTTTADFDGDGRTDRTVFRPSNGTWYTTRLNRTGTLTGWGVSTDIDVTGDYDGDAKSDVAVFRPSSGIWYIVQSGDHVVRTVGWGVSTDIPIAGDVDGDGKDDVVIYRPSTGVWYFNKSGGGTGLLGWGANGDVPMLADFDGDGKKDPTVYRPSTGTWYTALSTGGTSSVGWGAAGDMPVIGDWDGDGKCDPAIFRPSSGVWFISKSTGGTIVVGWGTAGDIPVSGNWDADNKSDFAVWRPSTGVWFSQWSNGGFAIAAWGVSGDKAAGRVPGS